MIDAMVRFAAGGEPLDALERKYAAPIYDPLDIVVESASGVWLTDVNGRRYLDALAGYSAVNQGHAHPRIVEALREQAGRLTITARAVRNTQLPRFLERLCTFCDQEAAIPMNTGAEAVETAIKLARRWGYRTRGIAEDRAEIIVCAKNFHGRTTTIVGFSSVAQYRDGFGPYSTGFRAVPFGDIDALRAAIGPHTAAFLVEPIQGEGGINVPPPGYLAAARALCRERGILFIADEIQTGLGRTGARFAYMHDDAKPDVLIVGKALSGGCYPVSAVLASRAVMGVFAPGDHGSTFAGNPLAAAVGIAALDVIEDEHLAERAHSTGTELMRRLRALDSPLLAAVRGRGLLIGLELRMPARAFVERLLQHGVVAKDTHGTVVRITPPLIIAAGEIGYLVDAISATLDDFSAAG